MAPAAQAPTWRGVARDCARTLARGDGPVSFVIGAGASLTSGAPSTERVFQALRDATQGRLRSDSIRALIHQIGESDKQAILRPLFEDISPYVGYLSLAALGRHRRVVVANLNWDPLIANACAALGVPCRSFDIADSSAYQMLDELQPNQGVVVIHLHGLLGTRSGISTLETLAFTEAEQRLLAEHVWVNPVVLVGASLVDDTDIEAMFMRLGVGTDGHPSKWLFARERKGLGALPPATMASRYMSSWPLNCIAYADVDFDELLVTILSEVIGFPYEELIRLRPTANLPEVDDLAFPVPDLLRRHLLSTAVVLAGEPKLGKTTLAHLLGWWRVLWSYDADEAVLPPVASLGAYEDAATTLAALASQGDDPTAGAGTHGKSTLVLDDPFGQNANLANPRFIEQLRRVVALPDPPFLVVATREPGWFVALKAAGASEAELTAEGIGIVASAAQQWWSQSVLLRYSQRLPHSTEIADILNNGLANTPGRIKDAAWVRSLWSPTSAWRPSQVDVLSDRQTLFHNDVRLARGAALARIQEFCSQPLTVDEFAKTLGEDIDSVPGLRAMLVTYSFEDLPRVRLSHPTNREAIDGHLADPGNYSRLRDWLMGRPLVESILLSALQAYKLIAETVADPASIADKTSSSIGLSEWAPQLLAASPTTPVITAVRQMQHDLWTTTELAYEAVRLYPVIKNQGGRELLFDLLNNRRTDGAYAVLEACLYLRSAATDEVWTALKAKLYELTAEATAGPGHDINHLDRQLSLIVDGLLWRPPPQDKASMEWLIDTFASLDERRPFWGLLRFAAGYHSGGLRALQVDALVEASQDIELNDGQRQFACWLMEWHLVHQSRARAIRARQPYVDKDFLCRSLHPSPAEGDPAALRRLMRSLLASPQTAGWVMHLGCNMMAIGMSVDVACAELMRQSVDAAKPGCMGLITTVMTYDTSSKFSDVLRPYFRQPENLTALLDCMRNGPMADNVVLAPPRFVCSRAPRLIQTELNLSWPRLLQAGFDASDPEVVAKILRVQAEKLVESGTLDRYTAEQLIEQVRRGDLRLIDGAATARHRSDDFANHLLQGAAAAFQEPLGLW
jgi:hypothetical protein